MRLTFTLTLLLTVATLFSQDAVLLSLSVYSTGNDTAIVDRQNGISIFMMSKPVASYTVLGQVKLKVKWTGEPSEMLPRMLDKMRKDYPLADGIIFNNIDMEVATAIKFNQ